MKNSYFAKKTLLIHTNVEIYGKIKCNGEYMVYNRDSIFVFIYDSHHNVQRFSVKISYYSAVSFTGQILKFLNFIRFISKTLLEENNK